MKIYQTIIIALSVLFVFGCTQVQPIATPTETLKNFIEASQKKDVPAIKKALSKNSLNLIEENAKSQNTTLDELLSKGNNSPIKELPETRSEKIENDTASVEVKNVITGDFDTIPFVKEDGSWKIALDKFIENVKAKMAEDEKMPPAADSDANVSKSEGDAEQSGASSETKTNKK